MYAMYHHHWVSVWMHWLLVKHIGMVAMKLMPNAVCNNRAAKSKTPLFLYYKRLIVLGFHFWGTRKRHEGKEIRTLA